MATQADVRRIALAQPETTQAPTGFAFSVLNRGKAKGFVWIWMERVVPKKPRVANPGVIAVRVPNLAQRDLLIATDSRKFFTEPHYEGFPAVLVRLDAVTVSDLKTLITDAWRCMAPKELLQSPAKRSATKAMKQQGKKARRTGLKSRER
jgi:hypothetical protein